MWKRWETSSILYLIIGINIIDNGKGGLQPLSNVFCHSFASFPCGFFVFGHD